MLYLAAFDMATAWLIFGNTATVWRSDFSEAAFIAKTPLESHISPQQLKIGIRPARADNKPNAPRNVE